MKKILALALAALLMVTLLAACGGGGIPNGKYIPTGDTAAYSAVESIVVSGNNFTFTFLAGVSQTNKYTYKNGTITFQDGGTAINVACTYDDSTKILKWAGIDFQKK
jgi:ABC-type phosphate transport system substrate-binding protein